MTSDNREEMVQVEQSDREAAAIARIEARFHPHYGIDGATDSRQLADDCRTLIQALNTRLTSTRTVSPPIAEDEVERAARWLCRRDGYDPDRVTLPNEWKHGEYDPASPPLAWTHWKAEAPAAIAAMDNRGGERAQIVAWLRERANAPKDRPDDWPENDWRFWRQGAHNALHNAADIIERGDHMDNRSRGNG